MSWLRPLPRKLNIIVVILNYIALALLIYGSWKPELETIATHLTYLPLFMITYQLGILPGIATSSIAALILDQNPALAMGWHLGAFVTVVIGGTLVRWCDCTNNLELVQKNKELSSELEKQKSKQKELQGKIDREFFNAMAMYEFTSILGSTLKYQEVLNLMVDTILRIVPYDACSLFLIDEKSQELYIECGRGISQKVIEETRYYIGEGVAGWVWQTAQPALVLDYERDPRFQHIKYEHHFCSALSLPLVIKGEVMGVLEILKLESNAFDRDDLRTLTIIANQAAFAIRNAQLYSEVMQLAITDSVTGLGNHRYFKEVLVGEMHRAQRYSRELSLLMLDIDHFKKINDLYGHQIGDSVLGELGRLLKSLIRRVDLVARYGGEEFCVILPETGTKEALEIAERIRKTVEGRNFSGSLKLTVSIGVATYPHHATEKDELIRAADKACYRAKGLGRNIVCSA